MRRFAVLLEEALTKHPLDRTVSGWGGLQVPEDNYHQKVLGSLIHVMQDAYQVSEKSFGRIDEIIADAQRLTRDHDDTVRESELNGVRPALCAELIFQMSGQS